MIDEQIILHVKSTPKLYIPGTLLSLTYMYRMGEQDDAMDILRDIFHNAVSDSALHDILSENRLPIFSMDDLADDAVAFVFSTDEVVMSQLDDLIV